MDTPDLEAPRSSSIYIGFERYGRVCQRSIDVSAETRIPVSPAHFVQHLIDHYSEIAQANWTQTLLAANLKKD